LLTYEEKKNLTQEYQVENHDETILCIQAMSVSFESSLEAMKFMKEQGIHLKLDEITLPKVSLVSSKISTL